MFAEIVLLLFIILVNCLDKDSFYRRGMDDGDVCSILIAHFKQ